jgi:hypothetical protein
VAGDAKNRHELSLDNLENVHEHPLGEKQHMKIRTLPYLKV